MSGPFFVKQHLDSGLDPRLGVRVGGDAALGCVVSEETRSTFVQLFATCAAATHI